MTTQPRYIMQDQVRDKVPAIMAYKLKNPAMARDARIPRPMMLALSVIVLNIAISVMAA